MTIHEKLPNVCICGAHSMDASKALNAIRSACYWAFKNGYGYGHNSTVEGTFGDNPEEVWDDIWDEDAQCFVDELVDCPELFSLIDSHLRCKDNAQAPNAEDKPGATKTCKRCGGQYSTAIGYCTCPGA